MELDEGTRALLADIAEETAQRTVEKTLKGLGVDTADPIAVQKDMATLRGIRTTMESAKNRGMLVVIAALVLAVLGAAWAGVRQTFTGH